MDTCYKLKINPRQPVFSALPQVNPAIKSIDRAVQDIDVVQVAPSISSRDRTIDVFPT